MTQVKCRHCKDFGHALHADNKCKHDNKNPHYDPTYDGGKARVAAVTVATAPVGASADDSLAVGDAVIAPSINDEATRNDNADDDNADAIECNLMDQVGFESDDDEFFDALDEADDYEE